MPQLSDVAKSISDAALYRKGQSRLAAAHCACVDSNPHPFCTRDSARMRCRCHQHQFQRLQLYNRHETRSRPRISAVENRDRARRAAETCQHSFIKNPLTPTVAIMYTAIKHPVPDRVKPSFVTFDIRAFWRSAMSVRVPGCQKLQMTA